MEPTTEQPIDMVPRLLQEYGKAQLNILVLQEQLADMQKTNAALAQALAAARAELNKTEKVVSIDAGQKTSVE